MRRTLKLSQLWLHHHYIDIRHWLVVVIGVILLIFSMVSLSNQNRLNQRVATLAEQNKVLSQQNKDLNNQTIKLAQDNQSIAKQNRSYTRCLATVFALYTHNFIPISITNLDTCTTDSQSKATGDTPAGGTSANGDPAPQGTSSPSSSSPNPAQPEKPQPKPLNCAVDLLGLHLGCP